MDRRKVFKSLFSEYNKTTDFELWIDTICEEFGIVADYIQMFEDLGSIDRTPAEFIQDLADLVAYSYLDSEDPEAQREIVKRIFSVYHERGTEASIIQAAKRSPDPDWIGGDLTLYKGPLKEETASVFYPSKHVFTHCVSAHSGEDAFQDAARWREGVIIIRLSVLNDRVREAIKKVIPAGLRYYFDIVVSGSEGDLDIVSFGEYIVNTDYLIQYYFKTDILESDALIFSDNKTGHSIKGYLSGRQVMFDYYEIEYIKSTTFLPWGDPDNIPNDINHQIPDIEYTRDYYGLPLRSVNAIRSGKYGFSGHYTGLIDGMSEVQEILPTDRLYNVYIVEDLKYNGFRKFDSPEFEVQIEKI